MPGLILEIYNLFCFHYLNSFQLRYPGILIPPTPPRNGTNFTIDGSGVTDTNDCIIPRNFLLPMTKARYQQLEPGLEHSKAWGPSQEHFGICAQENQLVPTPILQPQPLMHHQLRAAIITNGKLQTSEQIMCCH